MEQTIASGLQMKVVKSSVSRNISWKMTNSSAAVFGANPKTNSYSMFPRASYISSVKPLSCNNTSTPSKSNEFITREMSQSPESKPTLPGLPIDLRGKRAFIAGIADENGYGWAIAKSLAAAGAEILVGTWVPAMNIFETSLHRGKFDASRMQEVSSVSPTDAVFDNPEDVPEDIKANRRYAAYSNWTVQEVAECVKKDFGTIDILVHSLANGPEVTKPLLETSRKGYLAALSASSYSYVSLLKHFVPIMNPGGATISLTHNASERIIPGYGGGMSSAKAALESDTRVLAFEAGRRYKVRINTISAGPLRSRAAKAIGFVDTMIEYSINNAPLQKELAADEVGNAAAFLLSPLSSAITGSVVYVDNGLNAMGMAVDSPVFGDNNIPKDN
ncbi:enoyl-[acyl-carrier-protein] reductase [NADH], chloroplastic-like isoform X2 [Papaver somniferum]|uniref:enoyl-[acyl-carrier-protein] reductase [NADH], chloroplastic-like isoform X2 n=1 Tax=Papaver somniferum TaxID=3469 RepID=UPI000E6FF3BC|nr:enoyl-[acyl-carrier-protein] reductase [NADH], chloroplastic-like isoform X2 [Papaver somniferum]